MNDTSYTALGDEPVEARIVAWVLGEASAFEVAELERLCDERPELLVFHRRMLALHGLLTEAVAAQPDENWKLPPEKRQVLADVFGAEAIIRLEPNKERRIRHSARRALLAVAACLVLTLVVLQMVHPMWVHHALRVAEKKVHFTPGGTGAGGRNGDPLGFEQERVVMLEPQALSKRLLSERTEITAGPATVTDGRLQLDKPLRGQMGITAGQTNASNAPRFSASVPAAAPKPAEEPATQQQSARTESRVEALGSLCNSDQPERAKTADSGDRDLDSVAGGKKSLAEMKPAGPAPMPGLTARCAENAKDQRREDAGEARGKGGGSIGGSITTYRLAAADGLGRHQEPAPAGPLGSRTSGALQTQAADLGDVAQNKEWANKPADSSGWSRDAKELGKAIRAQEDELEDRRKLLSTIVRTKGVVYKGSDSFYDPTGVDKDQGARDAFQTERMKDSTREEDIKRGLDAQDYVDAKRDFERDQEILQQMKQKQKELSDTSHQSAPVKPSEESAAAEDPYSTFSLNISDASFQVAQAALAKGERPDPAGIKVEQFYNAVDYGDPSPAAGEPVAVAIEQALHPVIPARNLVRIALKTAADGRAASQPLRLTLLVDQSGSMVRDDRRAAMDQALSGLAGLLTPNDRVTVIGFARTPRLLADGWTGTQTAQLNELVNQAASEGGTNLEQALKLAEVMAERHKLAGAQNRIVLFTDGAVNLGDADPAHLAARVKVLRQKGLAFDIAGIAADDLNDELLGDLARHGNGRYYVVGKGADDGFARQLAGAFRPAAENVKVQVRFNPERVGHYQLIGFEKDRLHTEDFRNDAVDAAELAADEAGVAVYQVEPLPGGTGELGEVSVRFRDAASGQMVERAWTVPYDASAPAIDRATPSMQLAVLSMLAAEKLRGGPLAEAIDFKQLAAPRANIKRCYNDNRRVADVLHMLDPL